MSAFICSDEHISAIVRWAGRANVSYYEKTTGAAKPVAGREREVFGLLLAENNKSYNHRYNVDGECEGAYNTEFNLALNPLEIIKLCHSLEYQSSQHPEWTDSEAKAVLDAVISAATYKLPGYAGAPWTL